MKAQINNNYYIFSIMKKIIPFFVLFLALGVAKAQTAEQTLEWLNVKKAEISEISANTVRFGKIEITNEHLYAFTDDGATTTIKWINFKDIKSTNYYIQIISNIMYMGKNIYIQLYIPDNEKKAKYINALKHMATLKGAKLVDDDLF